MGLQYFLFKKISPLWKNLVELNSKEAAFYTCGECLTECNGKLKEKLKKVKTLRKLQSNSEVPIPVFIY